MTVVKIVRGINVVVVFMIFTTSLFIHKRKCHISPNRIDLITKLSKQLELLKYPLIETCHPHHLSGLSKNECWLLFKEYAFVHEEEEPKLVAIGKEIIKKCGGLPLAAHALGGLMRSRSTEKERLEVKESEIWTLPYENVILPALRLSYLYLTPTVKQCFGFCAIFSKDTKIMKDDLIQRLTLK
ncbi:unnamed protein product [Vicia faba]|uniref:NB-ARC domain-containing protein n=1 Tax=Vicia faba TaxID=3906 RepID=A0AAV0YI42_VICFA|nr:unnamed protein product [Vicia faba]